MACGMSLLANKTAYRVCILDRKRMIPLSTIPS